MEQYRTWKVSVTLPSIRVGLFLSQFAELDSVSSINFLRNGVHLLLDACVKVI